MVIFLPRTTTYIAGRDVHNVYVSSVNSFGKAVGFCDYEEQETVHGFYAWNETEVGETDMQQCVFGTRPDIGAGGRARRMCIAHRTWRDYDGGDCITELTFELQRLVSCNNTLSSLL